MLPVFQRWLDFSNQNDELLYKELSEIVGSSEEILDRFHKNLEFGTGGLRGIIGAGTNRLNVYTVRKISLALCKYLIESRNTTAKVVIAYDSRNFSKVFALEVAKVLSENGVKSYIFDSLRPTPELSFAIRYLSCDAGVVITASHNPAKYNGYKVYASDGGQITLETANKISSFMQGIDELNVKTDQTMRNIVFIGKEVDEEYYLRILDLCKPYTSVGSNDVSIVFTPLHGSGHLPVKEILHRLGFSNLRIVEQQKEPDGNFSTVKSPNPEEQDSFRLAIELAKEKSAECIFATDPDCDRIGVAILDQHNEYVLLTGNQIGALLINFLIEKKGKITQRDAVIKTVVTSELGALIAKSKGASVFETLTGFKYIGEKIAEFERDDNFDFMFGYEESFGFLAGNFVRDKDAVIASAFVALMVQYYKNRNLNILEVLENIYAEYGFFKDKLISYTFEGVSGIQRIAEKVEKFRNGSLISEFFPDVEMISDFRAGTLRMIKSDKTETLNLPSENVIKLQFEDKSWIAIRPSGTEPKLKIYISALGHSHQESKDRLSFLIDVINLVLES